MGGYAETFREPRITCLRQTATAGRRELRSEFVFHRHKLRARYRCGPRPWCGANSWCSRRCGSCCTLGKCCSCSCRSWCRCRSRCWTGLRAVSPAGVESAIVILSPRRSSTAGPDCRVKPSASGGVSGAGGCPTIRAGIVSPAGVEIAVVIYPPQTIISLPVHTAV